MKLEEFCNNLDALTNRVKQQEGAQCRLAEGILCDINALREKISAANDHGLLPYLDEAVVHGVFEVLEARTKDYCPDEEPE